ncbi:hypothetical protein [Salinibacterium sp. NK8237]|uniref:hypothetical protein n=1 Tax=Salinibacterium sp. NK8237 TaxID=2792038 RepID=UPI0018CDDB5C|nr:hypothetical protein [Salinibacterium sp. NK8237]MBH0128787.1 hypothetical protein [Salinibacterium sp. NK8237]
MRASLSAGTLTSIAGTLSYIAILVTAIFFASAGADAALLRSHLVPLTLLFGGLSLLFSVPSQISGAHGSRYPGGNSRRDWAFWTIGISIVFGVIFVACWSLLSIFGGGLLVGLADPGPGVLFLSYLALGYLPVAASDFIEGHLRGSGRFMQSSGLVFARASITSISYGVGVKVFDLDPLSLPIFFALGGVTSFLIGVSCVLRQSRKTSAPVANATRVEMPKLVRNVGLPVLASYILLSSVVSIQIVAVENGAGLSAQLAFSAMLMVQTLCIVAAIGFAAGVSSEVLRRAADDRLNRASIGTIVARTSTIIFAVEAVVLVVFLTIHEPAINVLLAGVPTTSEIRAGAVVFVIAALLTANNVFVLTVLEEIGLAKLSLILNIIYFGVLIGVTYWTAIALGTFHAVSVGLLILSAAASISLRILLKNLPLSRAAQ